MTSLIGDHARGRVSRLQHLCRQRQLGGLLFIAGPDGKFNWGSQVKQESVYRGCLRVWTSDGQLGLTVWVPIAGLGKLRVPRQDWQGTGGGELFGGGFGGECDTGSAIQLVDILQVSLDRCGYVSSISRSQHLAVYPFSFHSVKQLGRCSSQCSPASTVSNATRLLRRRWRMWTASRWPRSPPSWIW